MLSAVGSDGGGFEGLAGYLATAGTPTGVPGFDVSKRQPVGQPNGRIPGPLGSIPTSSARPGKMTNQRIVYPRLVTKFSSPADGGLDPERIGEGDIVFVHRYDGINAGYDVNRPTCMATLAQLNAVFKNFNPNEKADVDRGTIDRTSADEGILFMPAIDPSTGGLNDPRGDRSDPEWPGDRPDPFDRGDPTNEPWLKYDREMHEFEHDYPKWRWKHCKALASWTPDGICCATENEHRKDPVVGAGASNPGELLNVAIGGPTQMRNHQLYDAHGAHGKPCQHVDDGMRTLDKIFVGLVCTEQRDPDTGDVTHYTYQYKPFSSRQLAWAAFQRGFAAAPKPVSDALVVGGDNAAGPTVDEFSRMVQVWRVGSCLDARTGMLPYKCATVNVVVEEWSLEQLRDEYNSFFGETHTLAKEIGRASCRERV